MRVVFNLVKTINRISILENDSIEVKEYHQYFDESGVLVGSFFQSRTLKKGDDFSQEEERVQKVCRLFWDHSDRDSHKEIQKNRKGDRGWQS